MQRVTTQPPRGVPLKPEATQPPRRKSASESINVSASVGTSRAAWQQTRTWRDCVTSSFEAQAESLRRKEDALDKLRVETDRHLRKYSRRIKRDGEDYVKAMFALDPDADPETVAEEALSRASGGMFISGP